MITRQRLLLALTAIGAAAPVTLAAGAAAASPPARPAVQISQITEFSAACPGQNAEVEQAIDPARHYVYEEWMGCNSQIGFARSVDGGLHFGKPIVLAHSAGAWDPSVAVAPDGTVYAAFMNSTARHAFPVVAASFNHGRSFARYTEVIPRQLNNWGDRDFIAVGPTGTVYLTWDYGPSAAAVTYICSPSGSCAFATGDLNVVIQSSANRGRSFGPIRHVSPGFPASGADSAPLLVARDGHIYLEYQGYHMTSRTKFTMTTAHSFADSSGNGGRTWSRPVRIGPAAPTMNRSEWWIDGDIASDAAGNLYVTWDTQSGGHDTGWLSYSASHGRSWSRLVRVTPDTDKATHIVQVAGGPRGVVYVGWLADNSPRGYALYLRPFSIRRGWLAPAVRVSASYGNSAIWPGDTFGISVLQGPSGDPQTAWRRARVVVSWGSAVGGSTALSQDRAAIVTFQSSP